MPRNAQLSINPRTFCASFCKVCSGSELTTYKALQDDHPKLICFKALGDFDIVAFSTEDSINSKDLPTSSGLISSCVHLPLVAWRSVSYCSPELPSWLAGAPVAAFVLLELDRALYKHENPSDSISRSISHFFSFAEWSHDNLALYGGVGQAELVAILKVDNFDSVFSFVKACRHLTIGELLCGQFANDSHHAFSSTHTTALISYRDVIYPKNYNLIAGNVSASILIDCPPGFEANIRDANYFTAPNMRSVLGTPDLIVGVNEIPSGELIQRLLTLRECEGTNPQYTDTKTLLSFDVDFSARSPLKCVPFRIPEYPPLETECPGFDKQDPYLASRIRALTRKIWSKLAAPSTRPGVARMARAPMRMYGEANEYMDHKQGNTEPALPHKGILIDLLEKAEIGIAQRTESNFRSASSALHIPPYYGDGPLASLLAIETFIDFVFRCLYQTKAFETEQREWKGYVFFNDATGFQYTLGDVFSLPAESIAGVLSPEWNWTTLTHEISHSIFSILGVNKREETIIKEGGMRALSYGVPHDERVAELNRSHFEELFAHWFDYYHFFDCDHDFYQKTIWQSWWSVPFVYKDINEYVFRSFAIFVLRDIPRLHLSTCSGSEQDFLETSWDEYVRFMGSCLPDMAQHVRIEGSRNQALALAMNYLFPFSFLALRYHLDDFRLRLNERPISFDRELDSIFAGGIISGPIRNPFLLIREATRRVQSMGDDEAARDATGAACLAIIFSLRDDNNYGKELIG